MEAAEAAKFLALVSQLDSVDALALEQARRLSRAKALFPCNIKREGGQSLVIGGSSLVILEGKACDPL